MTDLTQAEARLKKAAIDVESAATAGDFAAMRVAHGQQIAAERDVARLKGETYADRLDLGVHMNAGAPSPRVVSDTWNTFVVFYLDEPDPAWDGTYVTVVDTSDPTPATVGLLHFSGVYLTNDLVRNRGLSKLEIIRCLKRYLAREIYYLIKKSNLGRAMA